MTTIDEEAKDVLKKKRERLKGVYIREKESKLTIWKEDE